MKTSKVTISRSEFLGLVYHDLFDYPLTRDELSFWRIGTEARPLFKVEKTGPFFHLQKKSLNVLKRTANTKPSERKWDIAQGASRVLSKIPTVRFVGATGALSMSSARQEDDIDLLIVSAVDSLWITRLMVYSILRLQGFKFRRRGFTEKTDSLCLNLWLDEENLSFKGRKNVYTAHELLQIKTLLDKDNIFQKILQENSWVWEYFPHAEKLLIRKPQSAQRKSFFSWLLRKINLPAYWLQLLYMRGKRTKEVIGRRHAFFHPISWQASVPKLFLTRLESFPHLSD